MTSFFPQCYHIRPNCLIENMCLQNIKLTLVISWIFHVNVVLRIKLGSLMLKFCTANHVQIPIGIPTTLCCALDPKLNHHGDLPFRNL